MSSFINKLSRMEDLLAGTGVGDEIINEAEEKLDITFAKDYRDYLKKYGIIAINGHELTGLGSDSRVNVVEVTQKHRTLGSNLREKIYVIEETNVDEIVYWQDHQGNIYRTDWDEDPFLIEGSLLDYLIS